MSNFFKKLIFKYKIFYLKVVVFAWRLFRNRLSTKDNLLQRNVIDNNSCMCASGCGSLETANHLFFTLLFLWIGVELYSSLGWHFHGHPVRCLGSLFSVHFLWRWLSGAEHFVKRHLVSYLCSSFSGINPLIGFESSIFELLTFICGKGKSK